MSYDLYIYGSEIDLSTLRSAIETNDLAIDGDGDASLIVVRGKRRRYSFTVGVPTRIEPEDVPEEITAVILGPTHVVEILVEGSAESEIPHAIRSARRVAAAMDGAVLDPQTDDVFRRGRSRAAERVERGLVSIVDVTWYVRSRGDEPARAAAAFIAAARRHLPEALPRRYGSFEPLQRRWDQGGEDEFIAFVEGDAGTVFFQATGPVQSGSIGRAWRNGSVVHSHNFSMLAGPLEDERWRRALKAMFVAFAQAVDAVYASAQVLRGIEWSGRSLWYGAGAEHATYLAALGQWRGLTPYPVWLSWFGREYAPLIRDRVTTGVITELGENVLLQLSEPPIDRDALLKMMAPPTEPPRRQRRWFGLRRADARVEPVRPWLPPQYLAVPVDGDPRLFSPPDAASLIPQPLRNLVVNNSRVPDAYGRIRWLTAAEGGRESGTPASEEFRAPIWLGPGEPNFLIGEATSEGVLVTGLLRPERTDWGQVALFLLVPEHAEPFIRPGMLLRVFQGHQMVARGEISTSAAEPPA